MERQFDRVWEVLIPMKLVMIDFDEPSSATSLQLAEACSLDVKRRVRIGNGGREDDRVWQVIQCHHSLMFWT